MPTPDLAPPMPARSAAPIAAAVRSLRLLGVLGISVVLVACASGGAQRQAGKRPGPAPSWERDGPPSSVPADLASVPDAVPMLEPFRSGTLRPYEVLGRSYRPITEDAPFNERGLASWYGRKFHGRPTAIGEPYDMFAMTAAHPTLPLPSYVRVRNPANQREIVVRVNDRGPFHPGRIIDLSYVAAWKLDLLRGVAPVEIERITGSEILAGSWRREPGGDRMPQVAAVQVPAPRDMPSPPPLQPIAATANDIAAVSTSRPATVATPLPVASPAPISTTPLSISSGDPMPAAAVQSWWVQLGAFRHRDGAEFFQRQVVDDLGWIAPQLKLRSDADLHRLQAGPYADRDQAAAVAERLRESLQLVPVIVERR
ncbi:septal ring lytic transglycosylase RlpA family protein [Piscinibacter sakaiensis]|uniref:septal ring lytic transglycosylase RlpA family protein n=1 Tax=Piscinibacter sakaiensis TaxID=1547922 RepID=UPI003AAC95FD